MDFEKFRFLVEKLFFFKNFKIHQILIWATAASFWVTRTLWGSFFRILSTLSSCNNYRNPGIICIHQAHPTYMLKIINFDIFCACCVPMCAYNVPGVCTYLMVAQSQKAMSKLANAVSRLFLRQKLVSVVGSTFCALFGKMAQLSEKKETPLLSILRIGPITRKCF